METAVAPSKFKINTGQLVKIIVFGILLILIGWVVHKLLDSLLNNPVAKGIGDALDMSFVALSQLTKGCCSQSNCEDLTDKESCSAACGCSWTKKSTTEDDSSDNTKSRNTKDDSANDRVCVSNTGLKPGEGGPFSTKCGLGLGLLIAGIVYAVLQVGAIVAYAVSNYKSSGTKLAEDIVRTTNISDKQLKEILDKACETTYEKLREEQNVSPEVKDKIKSVASERAAAATLVTLADELQLKADQAHVQQQSEMRASMSVAAAVGTSEDNAADLAKEAKVDEAVGDAVSAGVRSIELTRIGAV